MTTQFAPTWNNSGVDLTCIRANANDIASGGGSTLIDLLVNNASKFSVNKNGVITADGVVVPKITSGTTEPTGGSDGDIYFQYQEAVGLTNYVPEARIITINNVSYDLSANRSWNINATGIASLNGFAGQKTFLNGAVFQNTIDGPAFGFMRVAGLMIFERASAGDLLIREGTSAVKLKLTNTYTSSTSYEWLSIGWSSNVCTIATEKGSAGGSDRVLRIQGWEIPVNYTASPNATVNHLSLQATGPSPLAVLFCVIATADMPLAMLFRPSTNEY